MSNPVNVAGTRRQRVVTHTGVALERQAVYLPAETWRILQGICLTQGRSGSQVIQHLIELADRGSRKDHQNARSTRST